MVSGRGRGPRGGDPLEDKDKRLSHRVSGNVIMNNKFEYYVRRTINQKIV